MNKKGMLIVISGPAGSGKGTVVSLLREMIPDLGLSISATTRGIREAVGEKDGVHYYFLSRDDFEDALSRGEILEHTVYAGEYYGTPKKEVERVLSSGRDMILEIETDGAMQVKRLYPDAITIMLLPPDAAAQEARLRGRGTETEEVICSRLKRAHDEILLCDKYDYIVINEDNGAEKCAADIAGILAAEHHRPSRMKHITDTFFDCNSAE
jgi:guanylate kinase